MKHTEHFKELIGGLSLNPTREERIDKAYSNWESLLKKDDEIKDLFVDFYLQGSYATKTSIRPQKKDEEFDVDAVLLLELDSDLKPKEALSWLAKRMKENDEYDIKERDRCVRINYAGDFHMDVVLAKPSSFGDYIYIPSKKEGQWKKTNPAGFKTWCDGIHADHNYQFQNIVKLLRYWRDLRVGKDTAPKSILLTTLIGENMVGKNSIAESLLETLNEMLDALDSYIQWDRTVFVGNPSLSEENLARDWDEDRLRTFKKKLTKLQSDVKDAFDETDKEKSLNKWKEIFPKFPKELSEASNMALKINSGAIVVNSLGQLSNTDGIPSPKHRFFGGSHQ
ncbi:hypothetical protein AMS62_27000 [Bacillus sp. FJAT-18019]|nr:hypothetical protein AMS62_27000 [Bacillus sp. FJAT-18019]